MVMDGDDDADLREFGSNVTLLLMMTMTFGPLCQMVLIVRDGPRSVLQVHRRLPEIDVFCSSPSLYEEK